MDMDIEYDDYSSLSGFLYLLQNYSFDSLLPFFDLNSQYKGFLLSRNHSIITMIRRRNMFWFLLCGYLCVVVAPSLNYYAFSYYPAPFWSYIYFVRCAQHREKGISIGAPYLLLLLLVEEENDDWRQGRRPTVSQKLAPSYISPPLNKNKPMHLNVM